MFRSPTCWVMKDYVEGLRYGLELLAADPEAEIVWSRVLACQSHHVGICIDSQPAAERGSQVAQPLARAGPDVKHGVRRPQVARDHVEVIPRHRLAKLVHAREIPASPGPGASEKLIQVLLRVRLPHDRSS
jgi:hypothetical protein